MPRKHERVTFFSEVSLEFASGRREARISDLSEGGCFVECVAAVRPGDRVRLRIAMHDGMEIVADGEITYTFEGMGFGLRFTDLNAEAARRVAEFVTARASMESGSRDAATVNPQLSGYLNNEGERPRH